MLIYPGFTALDLIGLRYAFASMIGAEVKLVARTLAPVRSDTGVVFTPDSAFADAPENLDILFAPGGLRGTLDAMADAETIAFLKDRAREPNLSPASAPDRWCRALPACSTGIGQRRTG
jgi:cyclohexyl-isocyanide hydratase